MEKIILGKEKTSELHEKEVFDGYDFDHDGETYAYVEEAESKLDDDGMYNQLIYQRKSDGKYFSILVTYVRYGYESYDFEPWANEGEMIEVQKKERTVVEWTAVE